MLNDPFGFATVLDVSVVSEPIDTGCPVRFASARAASSGLSAARAADTGAP
jgi:hypothetical protein